MLFLKRFLIIIYCSLYKSSYKDDEPEFTVICVIAILLSLNAATVYYYIKFLAGYKVHELMDSFYGGAICFVILFMLYHMFIKSKKYIEIYENFQTTAKNYSPAVVTNVYIILTFMAFVSTFWLK